MREVLGATAYEARAPLIAAALAGERQWFAADFDHPTRGPLAVQAEYIPQIAPDGAVRGVIMLVQDITEQRAGRVARSRKARRGSAGSPIRRRRRCG